MKSKYKYLLLIGLLTGSATAMAQTGTVQKTLGLGQGIVWGIAMVVMIVCVLMFIVSMASAGVMLYTKRENNQIKTSYILLAIGASVLFLLGAIGIGAMEYMGESVGIDRTAGAVKDSGQMQFKYEGNENRPQ